MLYTLLFFLSSTCSLFHSANLFGSCIIHILYTEFAEIKKNNSGAKGVRVNPLKMGPIGCPETYININLRRVTSQKSEDTIYVAAEA